MAYLPDFENDVFISYRRAIDEGPDPWVQSFQRALERNLKQFVGDVVFWRDKEKILTGDQWREVLEKALATSAIYLTIISRTYLESPECRKELDQMLARMQEPGGHGMHRLFPVFKHPPKSTADVPPELAATQHREFFERRSDAPLGFAEIDPRDDNREFQQRLAWLAQELTVMLERLRGDTLQRFLGNVFVADVAPPLYRDRDNLCADLLHHRFLVVPEHGYIWHGGDAKCEVADDLSRALLSVHLVSPAAIADAEEAAHARAQLTLATKSMRERGQPAPLVWVASRNGGGDAFRALLRDIEGPFADEGIEVLTGGLEELKSLAYKRLPAPQSAPAAAPGDDVAVVVENDDFVAFASLRARLVESIGVDFVPVRLAGPAWQDVAAAAKALEGCRHALIFWGAQPEAWLQQVLRLPELAAHLGRERLCACLAQPDRSEQKLFVSKKASTARADDDAALAAFCRATVAP